MKRLEDQLRRALQQAAEGAGSPPPLHRRSRVRARLGEVFVVGITAVSAMGLLVAGAWAFSSVTGQRRASDLPAAQGASARVLVLDSGPDGDYVHGAVTAAAVSGNQIVVENEFEVGTDPDFAVNADGTRLFGVAHSSEGTGSILRVFDSTSGELLDEEPFTGWQGTTGLHITRKIATSPDGSYAFILVGWPTETGENRQAILTYDSAREEILPETAPLDGCGAGPLLFAEQGRSMTIACRQTSQVVFVEISESGALDDVERLEVPIESHETEGPTGPANPFDVGSISGGSRALDGSVYLATGDGRLYVVDTTTREIELRGRLLPEDSKDWISVPQVHLSSDGRYLLVGLGSVSTGSGNAVRVEGDDIGVFELDSLEQVQTIRAGTFWAFAPAPDGSVYMVDRRTGLLSVAQVGESPSARVLGHIGDVPSDLVVVPSG